MLTLKGEELVLDVATGTGRVARPLSKQIKGGKIIGVDQAQAMLDVGHHHEEPIPSYLQSAGEADKLPFKTNTFDRAFVSFLGEREILPWVDLGLRTSAQGYDITVTVSGPPGRRGDQSDRPTARRRCDRRPRLLGGRLGQRQPAHGGVERCKLLR